MMKTLMSLVCMVAVVLLMMNLIGKENVEKAKLLQEMERFSGDKEQAIRKTGDPCSPEFFWVSSFRNSVPILVVMGQTLSPDGHNDPGRYWLVPKSDRVELWYASGAPSDDMGKPDHQQKIGEKFIGGGTNPLCQGK